MLWYVFIRVLGNCAHLLIIFQVEATGSTQVANDAIHYVRKGGKLLLYSVYDSNALVHWSPMKIFTEEISVRSLFTS